jgi:nucleotide-binding universal stress UspA family protein
VTSIDLQLEAGRVANAAGFRAIIVALDLDANGDRALPVARALAQLGDVPVELLTVSSPNVAEDLDIYELRRRAAANGWPEDCCTVVHDNHVARAIADHVEGQDGALLVMASTAKRPLSGHLLGSVSEHVLRTIKQPVLLVGPEVPENFTVTHPTLVACLDRTDVADAAVPAIVDWMATFGGAEPWVTEVLGSGAASSLPGANVSSHVRRYTKLLAEDGVAASWGVLYSGTPERRLEEFATHLTDPVFVATSVRLTDGRLHLRSTTRQLVQRSSRPVLVVPANHEGTS